MAKYIVTSAWPYTDFIPHLGTVLHLLGADVYARFLRLMGHEVIYVTGSDEHGTPIELEARRRGVRPKELTDQVHEYDLRLFSEFSFSFSLYSRTESDVHKQFVQDFFSKLRERGLIYPAEEELPFCPNDKIFLPDRYVIGTCPYCGFDQARGDQCDNCGRLLTPKDLINPRCVLCGATPTWVKTINYFIDLSKVQEPLRRWLEGSQLDDKVKNYSLDWVRQGLRPRALTRDIEWGVPAPFSDTKGKTIYVWFDALLGYVSATKEYLMLKGLGPDAWKEWWLNGEVKTVYFIGKDNIPFHAIILPAMLLATGEPYVLPWKISTTDYLLYEGRHFSKSRRIGVWIDEALEIAPGDYWRWALIRLRPENGDASFQWSEFYRIVNSELNDDIGNLVFRVLSFISSRFSGTIPDPGQIEAADLEVLGQVDSITDEYIMLMEQIELKKGTDKVLEIARLGNRYLNERAPWDLIKSSKDEAAKVIYVGASMVKRIAHLIAPFMPRIADDLWGQLGLKGSVHEATWASELKQGPLPGSSLGDVHPLFRKLPRDFLDNINKVVEEAKDRANEKRPPLLKIYKVKEA
ncbi:MAG: methionine--tRNA ligase [Acidilobus sp.]